MELHPNYLPTCFHELHILIKYTKTPLIQNKLICHSGGLSQGWQLCLLPERSVINETGISQGHVKTASKSIRTSTVVVSLDLSTPTPSTSSAVKSPENTEKYPDDPEPETAGDIQMEFSSDWLYSPSIGAATKNYVLKSWLSICTV